MIVKENTAAQQLHLYNNNNGVTEYATIFAPMKMLYQQSIRHTTHHNTVISKSICYCKIHIPTTIRYY